jgi:hypothetical protein
VSNASSRRRRSQPPIRSGCSMPIPRDRVGHRFHPRTSG